MYFKTETDSSSTNDQMSFNKERKTTNIVYLYLFLIAFGVIFCSSYNPLNFRRMYVDSSVYTTVTQGITRGLLPYKDFADNKGPLTYLIGAPGYFLGGFTGIWITELIFMFVSVVFAYKIARFFGNQFHAITGTVFSFVALLAFFLVNAGTEEYSLPFLMISLYLFSRHYFTEKGSLRFFEAVILGSCFITAVMIRLNMFPLWAGFCTVITIELIITKRFRVLAKYAAGFIFGILLIAIPLYLYLSLNDIFEPFLRQVIFAGTSRGFSLGLKAAIKEFYVVAGRNNSFIPLLLGLFWATTRWRQKGKTFYIGFTVSCFLTILFLSFSSGGYHYNLVLIPFFVPAVTFFSSQLYNSLSIFSKKQALLILILFFSFAFSDGIIRYTYYLGNRLFNNSGQQLIEAGKIIDENTTPNDTVISLGINAYIYPFTQRNAASKYIYQGSGLEAIPEAKEEFISDILTVKPRVIAIFIGDDMRNQYMADWHESIYTMIANEYRLLWEDTDGKLYIRKTEYS